MNKSEYEKIAAKAKPVIAKLRQGEKVSDDEKQYVSEMYKAFDELHSTPRKLAYLGGAIDARKYIDPSVTITEEYRKRMKSYIKHLIKTTVIADVEISQKAGEKSPIFGIAKAHARTEASRQRKEEYEKLKAERAKAREERKKQREKEKAKRIENAKKRAEEKIVKLKKQAERLGKKLI